jgi:REP element-mobilizing transposase RayT
MPVKRKIPYTSGTFFITFTCNNWLPLIEISNGYHIVYEWFDVLRSYGHYINAYAIMPNHIHTLITFIDSSISINTEIGNGKRFMAYKLVKKLKKIKDKELLEYLQNSVEPSRKKNNKLHEIWRYSFDWKCCKSNQFKYQKLNYIHANPCKGKWKLAPVPEEYLHCSAHYYTTGIQKGYFVSHIDAMQDIPNSPPSHHSGKRPG